MTARGAGPVDRLRQRISRGMGRINKLDVVQFGLRGLILPFRVKHLHGPRTLGPDTSELVAISVMRNGELWLRSFLAHHRELGVRHFVILDNGSTDGSIAFLSRQSDVTLLSSQSPYHAYENTMKRYLAERFCTGRWCLCVDVDELFDYPASERVSLDAFLSYLTGKGYNAVLTQMLDMFSDKPLKSLANSPEDDLKRCYPFYDTSDISKSDYIFGSAGPGLLMHHGGIRKRVFGTRNGLTKVSLFRMDGALKPFFAWHHARNARLADLSTVLLHFPFVQSFYAKVLEAVQSGRYGHLTTDEYESYLHGLQHSPDLNMKTETARRLVRVDQLVDEGFLAVSSDYLAFAEGSGPEA